MYRVTDHWLKTGVHGFKIVQFRLERIEDQPEVPVDQLDLDGQPVALRTTVVQRQVRSSTAVEKIKSMHENRCQICGELLAVNGGVYAEGAHIRALVRPHLGPDNPDNILCLCPNHHTRFDYGGIYLSERLDIVDAVTGDRIGPLRTHPEHHINLGHVAYHRSLWEP